MNIPNYVLSTIVSLSILIFGWITNADLFHWFSVPIFFLGLIIGVEVIKWLKGVYSPLSINGLIWPFLFHFYFLSPFLHVLWDWHLVMITDGPNDWRNWYGLISILNVAGILLFKWVINKRKRDVSNQQWALIISKNRSRLIFPVFIFLCIAGQVFIYLGFGGIQGFIDFRESGIGTGAGNGNMFVGMGYLFAVVESMPIVLLIWIFLNERMNKFFRQNFVYIVILVLSFVALKFLFGGLRGGRTIILFNLIWFAGLVNIYFIKLTTRTIVLGIIGLFILSSLLFWYKHGGVEGIKNVLNDEYKERLLAKRFTVGGDERKFVLLADLSRTEIQSYALYKLFNSNYSLGYGRSYIGALFHIVPSKVLPNKPATFVKERTDLFYGPGFYQRKTATTDGFHVPLIFGFSGEALLNFGIIGYVMSFLILGYVIRLLSNFESRAYHKRDIRLIFSPFLIVIAIFFIKDDSFLILQSIASYGLIPFLVIGSCIKYHKRSRLKVKSDSG
ncbi:MAG: hypothetical protein JXQ90_07225 [Cyclobacteriaceae bacterium]